MFHHQQPANPALAEALRKAQADKEQKLQRQAENLTSVVSDWAKDDPVHVDPPIKNFATTNHQEKSVSQHAQQTESASVSDSPASTLTSSGANDSVVSERPPYHREGTLTERLFEYIRDNPGTVRHEVTKTVSKMFNANPSSVSSLIGQLALQRAIHQDPKTLALTTNLTKYEPLKSGAVKAALLKARMHDLEKTNPRKAAGIRKMAETRRRQTEERRRAAKLAREGKSPQEIAREEALVKARKTLAENRARRKLETEAKRQQLAAELQKVDTRGSGVDIDAAHKQAKPVDVPHTKQDVAEIVSRVDAAPTSVGRPALPDVRFQSAEDIVNAMTIFQARAVFKLLEDVFGVPH